MCDNDINYFGTILSTEYHSDQQQTLKAVRPEVLLHLWKDMIQSILATFSSVNIVEMDMLQAKLIKSIICFTKYYRTIPLLNAMYINKIANLRNIYIVDLINSVFSSKSKTT